jgi:hypothetical protein
MVVCGDGGGVGGGFGGGDLPLFDGGVAVVLVQQVVDTLLSVSRDIPVPNIQPVRILRYKIFSQ